MQKLNIFSQNQFFLLTQFLKFAKYEIIFFLNPNITGS